MRHGRTDHKPNVHIELAGGFPAEAADYAADKVLHLLKFARRPVLFVKVRLMSAGRDVVAQANMDVNGTPVISHSVGRSAAEAVDLLQDKLRGRLRRM